MDLTFVRKKRGFIGQSSTLTGIRRHRKIRDLRRVLRNWVIEARTEINHRETKKVPIRCDVWKFPKKHEGAIRAKQTARAMA